MNGKVSKDKYPAQKFITNGTPLELPPSQELECCQLPRCPLELPSLKITTILTFIESISLLSSIVLPSLNIIFWFSWCFGLHINPYYSRSFFGSGFLHLTSCVWDSPILLNTRVSFFFAVSHSILEVYHYLCVHSTNAGISFNKKLKDMKIHW